jgi:hypothetical protein
VNRRWSSSICSVVVKSDSAETGKPPLGPPFDRGLLWKEF